MDTRAARRDGREVPQGRNPERLMAIRRILDAVRFDEVILYCFIVFRLGNLYYEFTL